jgi:hypothetical protein
MSTAIVRMLKKMAASFDAKRMKSVMHVTMYTLHSMKSVMHVTMYTLHSVVTTQSHGTVSGLRNTPKLWQNEMQRQYIHMALDFCA